MIECMHLPYCSSLRAVFIDKRSTLESSHFGTWVNQIESELTRCFPATHSHDWLGQLTANDMMTTVILCKIHSIKESNTCPINSTFSCDNIKPSRIVAICAFHKVKEQPQGDTIYVWNICKFLGVPEYKYTAGMLLYALQRYTRKDSNVKRISLNVDLQSPTANIAIKSYKKAGMEISKLRPGGLSDERLRENPGRFTRMDLNVTDSKARQA